MKRFLPLPVYGIVLLAITFLQSCDRDLPGPPKVKKWHHIALKAIYEVPAPMGRTEVGIASLELLADNSLRYHFQILNLMDGDHLTNAHIHAGDAGTSGGILIPLNPDFVKDGAVGVVTGLRKGQVDTLLNMPVYINVHSKLAPAGICRGQLDKKIDFAIDVVLNGANERPTPVNTTATGLAILRLTTDKTLYSRVTVNNLESNDTLTVAHVHRGTADVAGPARIFLCHNTSDFGITKSQTLVDSLVTLLKHDPAYVNAHSRRHPPGIVRGQIR